MCSRWPCRSWRLLLGAAILCALLGLPRAARADSPVFEFSAGALALGGVGWLDRPSPSELSLPRSGQRLRYGALSGFVFGAGLALEPRFFGLAGLEVDVLFQRDRVSGDVDVGGQPARLSVGQNAVHVALLAKGLLPLDGITPFLVFGPELVFPGLPAAEAQPPLRSVGSAERYTLLTAGAGVELVLHEGMGLRVPLAVRGSFAPGLGDRLADRVRALPSDAVITASEIRYQIVATAGATLKLF